MRPLSSVVLLGLSRTPAPTPAPAASAAANENVPKILVDRIDVYRKSRGIVVGTIGPEGSKIYSYGALDATQPARLPDGDTVFEIGSATKVFTSLVLADMVQRGEVKLDDPVSKYLPTTVKMPERNGRKITLLDLATHTSGLPRLPANLKPKDPSNPYADYTAEQMHAFLSGYELTRDIGSRYKYSTLSVGLLGHVLALRADMDYEKLVQTRVLGPLKMTSSGITLTPETSKRLARGHSETVEPVPNWDSPALAGALAGAGAIRSTANDLLKFLAANIGLTQTSLAPAMKSMLDVRKPTGVPNLEVALAWHVHSKENDQIIWHNGGTSGYHCGMGFDPKTRRGAVVLSNSTNDMNDIGYHLVDSRYPLATLTVAKTDHEMVAEVKRQGDGLFVQLTRQPQLQIFPESITDFFWRVVRAFQHNRKMRRKRG
jgi:serine-type D-Ala-D-Ala carboxypeptidase/endopeptidase